MSSRNPIEPIAFRPSYSTGRQGAGGRRQGAGGRRQGAGGRR
ncbi:hypothetical protein V0288_00745 [Pannus brasiliensis CCIBt3594]|uniref:Uncharacterized protein n=1 Tax=Pannus brasiliensis CCIBt3594 TaxID=1427578 RepID=A0AAW9QKF7_9CHRO